MSIAALSSTTAGTRDSKDHPVHQAQIVTARRPTNVAGQADAGSPRATLRQAKILRNFA